MIIVHIDWDDIIMDDFGEVIKGYVCEYRSNGRETILTDMQKVVSRHVVHVEYKLHFATCFIN